MKKIFFVMLMTSLLVCFFAFSACAAEVDYKETATFADGTVVPIYDDENNPLIWYVICFQCCSEY